MTRAELAQTLLKPDLRTIPAREAQRYIQHKGYPDAKPFGMTGVREQNVYYYYYELPSKSHEWTDLLELEVSPAEDDQLGRSFKCIVTCFREGSW